MATDNFDPGENNIGNYTTGQQVIVTDPVWGQETRNGFVAKQIDDRHFLVRLEYSFSKTNPQSEWLQVCRDYAHQSVLEI